MDNQQVDRVRSNTKKTHSLALSGGVARGIAHLGVLRALEEQHISIAAYAGTSAGSIVAVLAADGYSAAEIFEMFKKKGFFNLVKLNWPSESLLSMEGLLNILKQNLRAKKLEELNVPVFITATELKSGKLKLFSKGHIIPIIQASCSIPGMFPPVKIDGKYYVDGGLCDNLPVKALLPLGFPIISSDVMPLPTDDGPGNLYQVIMRSFAIIAHRQSRGARSHSALYLAPKALSEFSYFALDKEREMMSLAYDYACEALMLYFSEHE